MKWLLATRNEGKIREYRHLLREAEIDFEILEDLGIKEKPEEAGSTCRENAILKAKFYFEKSGGMPTIADDGGLEIEALGGEPGSRSRRWPGYEASDEELVEYVLERMKGIPQDKRTAHLTVVLAIIPRKGEMRTFLGTLKGRITEKVYYPIIGGYPFRSIFYDFQTGKVLSQLSIEKLPNAHREQAFLRAIPFLKSMGP